MLEINARVWLRGWKRRDGEGLTLATVPETEFERWRALGLTHLWLIGIWPTGPRSRRQALQSAALREACDAALPGWTEADFTGSPYAIAGYEVPRWMGGAAALVKFRDRLHQHGIRLILDFIPNHVGLDHPWVREHPGRFVAGRAGGVGAVRVRTVAGPRWLAHGRDPHFPPWNDTLQLDLRNAETRVALTDTLRCLASLCDGVRCDMAMLFLNEVFDRTWQCSARRGSPVTTEFWEEAIAAIKAMQPGFTFIGEVYWGLEARLQALGFDFTYDKGCYDYLAYGDPAGLQRHLLGLTPEFLARSVHFLENHDERRIASVLSSEAQKPATLLTLALPGLTLLHEGQVEGARLRVPVHLGRHPVEPVRQETQSLHVSLMNALKEAGIGQGSGRMLAPTESSPGNPTWKSFVVIAWEPAPERIELVVTNLAPHRGQCFVPLGVAGLRGRNWRMRDRLGTEVHERRGEDLLSPGLYLDIPACAAQLFSFEPVSPS